MKHDLDEKTRLTLGDLIEQAEKLDRLGFSEHVKRIGLGFRISKKENDAWLIHFSLPDEKEMDATLFTFRLFNQQNEAYSFHRLSTLGSVCKMQKSV
ncbi:MAG: hypothetical protein ACOYZ8_15895 [Chloroflexota bacterium]